MNNPGTVVHVVLTQWRSETPREVLAEIARLTGRFATEIPGIVSVVEGPSVSTEGLEGEFEWALVVTFESPAARDGYLDHAAHLPVAVLIGQWSTRVVVFDLNV